jgi:hypothetical protein
MPQPTRGDTQERKSLTHRLDLSGVATPRNKKPNGGGDRARAQKPPHVGHKTSEPGAKSSNNRVHEEVVMTQTATEQQVAAAAEQIIGDGLDKFKGLDIKVRMQKSGTDWGKVGETACYVGIGVVGAAAGTAAILGTARLLGYGPNSSE